MVFWKQLIYVEIWSPNELKSSRLLVKQTLPLTRYRQVVRICNSCFNNQQLCIYIYGWCVIFSVSSDYLFKQLSPDNICKRRVLCCLCGMDCFFKIIFRRSFKFQVATVCFSCSPPYINSSKWSPCCKATKLLFKLFQHFSNDSWKQNSDVSIQSFTTHHPNVFTLIPSLSERRAGIAWVPYMMFFLPARYKVPCAYQEKNPARNVIYAHAQDFAASDELLLAILKAFIPQLLKHNRQQAFMCSDEFNVIQCRTLSQHPQYTVQVHSLHATLHCLMFSVCM
jgi:hypothetical protein